MNWHKWVHLYDDDGKELEVEVQGDTNEPDYWEFVYPDDDAKVQAHLNCKPGDVNKIICDHMEPDFE